MTLAGRTVRVALLIVAGAGALLGFPVPLTAIILTSLTVYDGLSVNVPRYTAILILFELVGGLSLGVFSLPYVAVAALLALVGTVLALTPWSGAEGWSPADGFRSAVLSTAAAWSMLAGGVLVQAAYDGSLSAGRWSQELPVATIPVLVVGCLLTLVVLRRGEVPFRRRVRFGG